MPSLKTRNDTICLLCGQKGRFQFSCDSRDIYFCHTCGLGWISNFTFPDYKLYHRDATYHTVLPLFENIFEKLFDSLSPYFKKPGRMFDVGASVGTLLDVFMKKGWKVAGLEPSESARQIAVERGFNVAGGTFEEFIAGKDSYDLVVINHTLEHVGNPLDTVSKINSMLVSGGYVLVGVPNFSGWSAKILKGFWGALLPQEHKWQFSYQSLTLLLERSGFDVVTSFTTTGVFDCKRPFKELTRSFFHKEKRFFSMLLGLPWAYLTTKLGVGDGIVVIARKR